MRFRKVLIVTLLLFVSIFCIEADPAYVFNGSRIPFCEGMRFNTSTAVGFTNLSGISPNPIGWKRLDGTDYDRNVSNLYEAYIDVRSSGDTAIFWSTYNSQTYYDTIYIQAVPRPFVAIHAPRDTTICYGEEIYAVTDERTNADEVTWYDLTTMRSYNDSSTIALMKTTTFLITARSRICGDAAYHQIRYAVNVRPQVDTTRIMVRTPWEVELCPGCTYSLEDLIEYDYVDSVDLASLSWTLNGNKHYSDTVKMPISLGGDLYEGTLSAILYKSNECGLSLVTLTNVKVSIRVKHANECRLQSRWSETRDKTLVGEPCPDEDIYFQVVNPLRESFEMTTDSIHCRSQNGYPLRLDFKGASGGKDVYRFRYDPKNDDTIYIEAHSFNKCQGKSNPIYYDTLYFKAKINLLIESTYCIGDTLKLEFYSYQDQFSINKIVFNPLPSVHYADSFHTVYPLSASMTSALFHYKDTIHSWIGRPGIPITVHFTSCGEAKTLDTTLYPGMDDECYPRIEMIQEECKGDTNLIMIHQRRLPNAYIVDLDWVFPPNSVQEFGYYDTVFSADSSELIYAFKLISYTTDSISYNLKYYEKGPSKDIHKRIRNMTKTACNPDLYIESLDADDDILCRGAETWMELGLSNKNGRIIDVKFTHNDPNAKIDTQFILQNSPNPEKARHYMLKMQKAGRVRYELTYSYGDSIAIYDTISTEVPIEDCLGRLHQPNPIDQTAPQFGTYCQGDELLVYIIPNEKSPDYDISDVVWDKPSWLSFTRLPDGGDTVKYMATIPLDTLTANFVVSAHIKAVDSWKDTVDNYVRDINVAIHPLPKLYDQLYIDVCEENTVDLKEYVNPYFMPEAGEYWDPDIIWNTVLPYNSSEINTQMPYIAPGEDEEKTIKTYFYTNSECVFLKNTGIVAYPAPYPFRNTRIVVDSVILRRNSRDALSFNPAGFGDQCVNDTLYLNDFVSTDRTKPISWLRIDDGGNMDTLHHNVRADSAVIAIVGTDKALYVAFKNTVCSDPPPRDTLELDPTPAPMIKGMSYDLRLKDSVCLYDTVKFRLELPNDEIDPSTTTWYLPNIPSKTSVNVEMQVNDTLKFKAIVRAKSKKAECWGQDTVQITPLPLPNVNIKAFDLSGNLTIPDDSMRCEKVLPGDDFDLKVRGDGALKYEWILPEDLTDEEKKGDTLRVRPTIDETVIYSVQGTDQYGCKNTANYYIAIIEAENFKDTAMCEKSSFGISSILKKDMIYRWDIPNGSDIVGRNLNLNNLSRADSGQYVLHRSLYGCPFSDSFNLRTKIVPKADVIEKTTELCEGSLLRLLPRTNATDTQYWRNPQKIVFADSVHIDNAQLSDSGTYMLIVELEGCKDSTSQEVRVDRQIQPEIKGVKPFYCDGEIVYFEFNPATASAYQLKMPSKSVFEDTTRNPQIKVNYPADSGIVVLLVKNRTCEDMDTVDLNVRYRPDPKPIVESTQYCNGDTIRMWVDNEKSGVVYSWKLPNNKDSVINELILIDINPTNDAGHYQLKAVSDGCETVKDVATIEIFPLPALSVRDTFLCMPGDSHLVDVYRPNALYQWSTGANTPSIYVSKGDDYSVTVTEKICSSDAAFRVEERPNPVFEFGYIDTTVCYGTDVYLNAPVNSVTANYYWLQTGENSEHITVRKAGVYTLHIEDNGCEWSDSIRLISSFCGQFHIPTAFSPNSQIEKNRTWRPFIQAPKDLLIYEIIIFDKWGKEMFRSTDWEESWDGKHKGKDCQPAVYTYIIKAHETLQGTDLSTHGTVTLIR